METIEKDLNAYSQGDIVIVEGIKDFDFTHTFECGQCFRWEKQEDNSYTGIAFGRLINLQLKDDKLIIKNTDLQEYNQIWRAYLDLDRDYTKIKQELGKDEILKAAAEFGGGMRILKQELWECLVSFIISSNNMIPRIKKIIKSLSEEYGRPIEFEDKVYYSFPKPEDLYEKTEQQMDFCKSGYRCKYILDAAKAFVEDRVSLSALDGLNTEESRDMLMKIQGIGPKVADCILLYSLQKHDVFPTDVWVRRVMGHFYLGENPSLKQVQIYAKEHFGGLAGFAQQYLFYYARELKLGK